MFEAGLLRVDPETALTRPNTVVITNEMANKYFGSEEPLGKVIEVWVESLFYCQLLVLFILLVHSVCFSYNCQQVKNVPHFQ